MSGQKKILVVEDNEDVRELIVFLIENEFEVDLKEAGSGNKAIELLKEEKVDIVISDFNMPDGNGEVLYQYIVDQKLETKFILLSTVIPEDIEIFKTHPIQGFAAKPFFEEELTALLKSFLSSEKSEEKVSAVAQKKEYLPIKISTLKRLKNIEFDLYIELSNKKYILVEKEKYKLSSEYLKHYEDKGMTHLFLQREKAQIFSDTFKKELLTSFYAKEMPIEESYEALLLTSDVVHQVATSFGLTDEIKEIANKNIQIVLNQISKEPQLKDLISRIQSNKESYFAAHCSLLTYVCGAMAHAVDWSSDVTLYKLTMASFLHDLSLNDIQMDNKQNHILSIQRGEFLDVSDVIAVKEHPEKAAEISVQWPVIHPDIDQIILQHHEQPDGSGFPKGVTYTKIHPLSALFIIAETFVDFILIDDNKNFNEFFDSYEKKFSQGEFKRIFQEFKKQYETKGV